MGYREPDPTPIGEEYGPVHRPWAAYIAPLRRLLLLSLVPLALALSMALLLFWAAVLLPVGYILHGGFGCDGEDSVDRGMDWIWGWFK